MVAAAAASLLWGNSPSGPMFGSEHTQTAVPAPPQLSCCSSSSSSSRYHPHQPPAPPSTLPTTFQPVDMVVHQSDPPGCAHSCLGPPMTVAKQHDQTESQCVHDDVVREGSEAASSLEESIRVSPLSSSQIISKPNSTLKRVHYNRNLMLQWKSFFCLSRQ